MTNVTVNRMDFKYKLFKSFWSTAVFVILYENDN